MDIAKLQKEILVLAEKKGWGTTPDEVIFSEKIALLHQEVSEVLEAYRKGKMHERDGLAEEFADIVLRTFHLAGIYNIDVTKAIQKKLARNAKRDWSTDQLYLDKKRKKR